MAFFTWSDDFLTGIEIVDRQHRRLVELINAAAPVLQDFSPERQDERQALFTGLLDYTGEHFRTEEELMRVHGIDARVLSHHCQSHTRLLEELLEWQARLSRADALAGHQFLGFLAGWLLFHVLGEDQAMSRQVRAMQAGMAAERAYEAAKGAYLWPSQAVLGRTVTGIYTQMSGQLREIDRHGKQLEEQLHARTAELLATTDELRHARDAAEAASQAKSRFLGMVSHELRTPMNAIIGCTELLRKAGLPAQENEMAGKVLNAAEQLVGLVDGLIEFTRNEPGQSAPFSLRLVMTEACQVPFAAARAKGLTAVMEIPGDLPAYLHGDARRIAVVIRQLTANAAKFTTHGSIRVRAEVLGTAPDGDLSLRISVTDTGIGIPADKQAGLFNAFHQLDDSPTRRYGGVGLGLALTRQAARMMGADIDMQSTPGKGSVFWIDLQLSPAAGRATTFGPTTGQAQPAKPLPTGSDGTAILRRLDKLLGEDDIRAAEVLADNESFLQHTLDWRFETLARQIAGFEYDKALLTLREWQGVAHPAQPPLKGM
ncbi:MAG: hemerythrin domain-containing protein [Rhodocyclaceae bacterium]|nr:hemerythrin domain-containing protein [Rhodocyclaceae bacterium]